MDRDGRGIIWQYMLAEDCSKGYLASGKFLYVAVGERSPRYGTDSSRCAQRDTVPNTQSSFLPLGQGSPRVHLWPQLPEPTLFPLNYIDSKILANDTHVGPPNAH